MHMVRHAADLDRVAIQRLRAAPEVGVKLRANGRVLEKREPVFG
jgi:hypothetical protein